MTKQEKLLKRLLNKPKDFSYNELSKLLASLGYEEIRTGKTSGSRVAYISGSGHIVRLHKPHPNNELKEYQLSYVIEELKKKGVIE
jgi:hypothetical protein